jgi:hypothetical protein
MRSDGVKHLVPEGEIPLRVTIKTGWGQIAPSYPFPLRRSLYVVTHVVFWTFCSLSKIFHATFNILSKEGRFARDRLVLLIVI